MYVILKLLNLEFSFEISYTFFLSFLLFMYLFIYLFYLKELQNKKSEEKRDLQVHNPNGLPGQS